MPQVPYSGAPQVEPQNDATPRLSANTPIGAFGGDVAQATSHLGDTLSTSGNQIFARGVAMQDLYNHSQASQAVSDYQEQAGEIHAKFSALQGKDAVAAFPQYIADLKSARQKIQDGLDNPATQQMFQGASLSFQGRTIFNGAGHAASENKNYAIGAAAARVKSAQSAALMSPNDDDNFNTNLEQAKSNTIAQWQLKGADQDTIDNAVQSTVSDAWVGRIQTLAKTQPFQANAMLEKATKDGSIRGEALGKITNLVQGAMHTVGARNVSQQVRSGADLSPGAGIVDQSRAREAIGQYESGANYSTLGPQTVDASGNAGQALGKYQVMSYNLPSWLKQAGLPPMSAHDFVADHAAQDKVFDTIFGGYQQKYGSFNAATKAWFGGEGSVNTDPSKLSDGYHTADQYLAATNKTLAGSMGLPQQVAAGRNMAQAQSPNDPLFGDYVEQRIIADHNQARAVERDQMYTNRQTVESGLIGGGQNGQLPTSVEDLKAQDPKIAEAWDNLEPSVQRRYLGVMAKNAKGDTAWNNDKLVEYQKLKGMAQSDPSSFLDQDVVGSDLPMSARKELVNLQIAKKANAETDPRVMHALQLLRPTLQAAQVTPDDKDNYNQFVGSLQGALEDYSNQNKKPADAKAINEIGQRLLQQQAGTGYFGSSIGGSKLYQLEVPSAARKTILADPFWAQRGIVPTDDQIQRIYVRQTYNSLYGGKPKSQSAAGPSVPMSK